MPHQEAANPTIFSPFKGLGLTKSHPYFLATSVVLVIALLDLSGVNLASMSHFLETRTRQNL
ncbi:hypothetical protein BJ508DRAFT_412707, partial [Ascobolus immersus RN42]